MTTATAVGLIILAAMASPLAVLAWDRHRARRRMWALVRARRPVSDTPLYDQTAAAMAAAAAGYAERAGGAG